MATTEPTSLVVTSTPTMKTEGQPTDHPYRTLTRKTAVLIFVLVIGVGALGVWLGLLWVEQYANQMSELIDSSPERARIKLAGDLKLVAVATGAILWALAAFLFWYAVKSLRTQSMPPRNSWVIEGQPIRTGAGAVFRAKFLLVASVVIGLFGIVGAAMLWHVPIALLASQ